jgi:DNA-directed RNA polymerase subunit RPC12/RpoP
LDLYKALYAFYKTLVDKDCEHTRVHMGQNACFCPDCGYKVLMKWSFVRCRDCDAKRIPRRLPDGKIAPLHKYCRHCGSSSYRLVKRDFIEAFELLYGLLVKEIDYTEERRPVEPVHTKGEQDPLPLNKEAIGKTAFDVVDGQVIRKRYFTKTPSSAWGTPPLDFQEGRNQNTSGSHTRPFRNIS